MFEHAFAALKNFKNKIKIHNRDLVNQILDKVNIDLYSKQALINYSQSSQACSIR